MSTSSALASAKRRRANLNQPPTVGNAQVEPEPETKPKFTPVQLLQLHELRIKKLEVALMENNELSSRESNTNAISNTRLRESAGVAENNIEILNMKEALDNKIKNLSSILKPLEDKLTELYENYSNLKEQLKELDTFKIMLIKNQSDIIDNHKIISDLNKKVEDINKQQDKNDHLEEFYNQLNNNSDDLLEKLISNMNNTNINIINSTEEENLDNILDIDYIKEQSKTVEVESENDISNDNIDASLNYVSDKDTVDIISSLNEKILENIELDKKLKEEVKEEVIEEKKQKKNKKKNSLDFETEVTESEAVEIK